jgi:hypothetical protein
MRGKLQRRLASGAEKTQRGLKSVMHEEMERTRGQGKDCGFCDGFHAKLYRKSQVGKATARHSIIIADVISISQICTKY